MNANENEPEPSNEKELSYAPGTPERAALPGKLAELGRKTFDIPLLIGGRELRTGRTAPLIVPHDRGKKPGVWHKAGAAEVDLAIAAAARARADWARRPWRERAEVFKKAAELATGSWRATLVAATMLGLSKSVQQAEADIAELADHYRFNAYYLGRLCAQQPPSPEGERNRLDYRPLEGFVLALTPFNFTSIAGNLPAAPALMGNAVLWKPASAAVLPAYYLALLWREAGLPDGVINMIPGPGGEVGARALDSGEFAGLNFTGTTPVFNTTWTAMARNLHKYKSYPRVIGETGGKGFVFAHASCDPEALAAALIRGAYDYQGQKWSSAARAYVPRPLWERMKGPLAEKIEAIKVGPPEDFSCFMNAVIDELSFDSLKDALELAGKSPATRILAGGGCDKTEGYFVRPTLIETSDPLSATMQQELLGPVLTIYPYKEERFAETLELCDGTSPYALTGALFASDEDALRLGSEALAGAAGNFYVNDKPTGAMVNRQPFGGGRASGTDDKVGWPHHLLRWTMVRSVKRNLAPPRDYRYPFMG